ncbi:MAG: DUF6491 family protein [bacterium]
MKNKFFLLLSVFLLMSCAANKQNESAQKQVYENYIRQHELKEIDTIQAFYYSGWSSLDDSHLIVTTRLNKSYLLSLNTFCDGLDFAATIKVNQSNSSRLSSRFDSISVPGNINPRCTIDRIYELSKEQRKELTSLRNL